MVNGFFCILLGVLKNTALMIPFVLQDCSAELGRSGLAGRELATGSVLKQAISSVRGAVWKERQAKAINQRGRLATSKCPVRRLDLCVSPNSLGLRLLG